MGNSDHGTHTCIKHREQSDNAVGSCVQVVGCDRPGESAAGDGARGTPRREQAPSPFFFSTHEPGVE
jgi:hypothetical protein